MDTLYSLETLTKERIKSLQDEGLVSQAYRQESKISRGRSGAISRIFSWILRENISPQGNSRDEIGEPGNAGSILQA